MRYLLMYAAIYMAATSVMSCHSIKNNVPEITGIEGGNLKKDKDYYTQQITMRHEDYVYLDYIKTVQLYITGNEFSNPIIDFNDQENSVLDVSFDDINGGFKYYTYSFILCNYDWTPSRMFENQYIDGFTEGNFQTYRNSFNTRQKYTSYSMRFPNAGTKFSKAGNYILFVYEDGNKEKPVFTKRFSVVNHKVNINAMVVRSSVPNDIFKFQAINVTVDLNNVRAVNPLQDIKLVIQQNYRWDNALYGIKPVFIA